MVVSKSSSLRVSSSRMSWRVVSGLLAAAAAGRQEAAARSRRKENQQRERERARDGSN